MISSHFIGVLTTVLIHGIIGLMVLGFSDSSGCSDANANRGKLQMTTIEAALAYKSREKTRQPQKRRKRASRKVKLQGVSRNASKKVSPKKNAEEDFSKEFEKYMKRRQRDDEDDEDDTDTDATGDEQPPKPGGQFDGSDYGFAEVNQGDPYIQKILADFYSVWSVPTLEKGKGVAVGCVHVTEAGRIDKIELKEATKNANIDRSVKLALKKLQKKRNKNPKKVPKHLLDITTQWTCFRPNV